MTHGVFVRSLWGDGVVERHPTAIADAKRSREWEFQPEPTIVYAFGVDNFNLLVDMGWDNIRLMSSDPMVDFLKIPGTDRCLDPRGAWAWGIPMWRHKFEVIRTALQKYPDCVWLDFDCNLCCPLPEDFWERMRQGAAVQGTLVQYHQRQCGWRDDGARQVPEGAFLYFRGLEAIEACIRIYEEPVMRGMIDQQVIAKYVDDSMGGWKGADGWRESGYRPYCHRIYYEVDPCPEEDVLFRTARSRTSPTSARDRHERVRMRNERALRRQCRGGTTTQEGEQ